MRLLQSFLLLLFVSPSLFSQINLSDSTFQAVGYWNKGEKQVYTITNESYKIEGADTARLEFLKYSVDITVADSTADSYIIDWLYRDYELESDNEFTRRLMSLNENMKVRIKTDEFGMFKEVVNWEELRETVLKALEVLKKEFSAVPNMDQIVDQTGRLFSSREAIESAAVKEIQQFYTFHGGKYKLGEELTNKIKLPNLYQGDKPFDTEITVWLDELAPDDRNAVLRTKQTVDSEQLTKATFNYLVSTAEALGTEPPKADEFPALTTEIWVASRIHNTGWVIYSVETREVSAEGTTRVQNRIIEIQ
jgi:hypothetical protein